MPNRVRQVLLDATNDLDSEEDVPVPPYPVVTKTVSPVIVSVQQTASSRPQNLHRETLSLQADANSNIDNLPSRFHPTQLTFNRLRLGSMQTRNMDSWSAWIRAIHHRRSKRITLTENKNGAKYYLLAESALSVEEKTVAFEAERDVWEKRGF